jgi:hypothetical protein
MAIETSIPILDKKTEDKNMAVTQHDGIAGTRGFELDSTACRCCAMIVRSIEEFKVHYDWAKQN